MPFMDSVVNTRDAFQCAETLRRAVDSCGAPEIFNSAPGSQLTCAEFAAQLRASWHSDQHGRAWTLFGECPNRVFPGDVEIWGIKIKEYVNMPQFRFSVQHYVNFYNSRADSFGTPTHECFRRKGTSITISFHHTTEILIFVVVFACAVPDSTSGTMIVWMRWGCTRLAIDKVTSPC